MSADAAQAEADRIDHDMRQLAERSVWQGVDRRYRLLDPVLASGAIVPADVHLLGAEAARNLGDIEAVLVRLARARVAGAPLGDAEEQTRARFGRVSLLIDRRVPSAELRVLKQPFELDARKALWRARAALEQDRRYVGMLPIGEYALGGTSFTVTSGDEVLHVTEAVRGRVESSPRRAATQADAAPARGRSARSAPRRAEARPPAGRTALTVRVAAGGGGTSAPTSGLQPLNATLFTPRAALRVRVPLDARRRLQADIGWLGMLGDAFGPHGGDTRIQAATLQAGAEWATGDWWLGAAGLYAFGAGRATGADPFAASVRCPEGADWFEEQAVCERLGADATNWALAGRVEMTGVVGGPGLELSLTRPLPARDDAVPHLGAQAAGFFDGRRLYAWLGAELGVTFGAQR